MSEKSLDQIMAEVIELNRKHNEQELTLLNLVNTKSKQIEDMMGMLLLLSDAIQRASKDGVKLFRYLTLEEQETLDVLLARYGKGYKS